MTSTVLAATSYFGGECIIEFTEAQYTVLSDTRKAKDGYLHITDASADVITDACRDTIITYLYGHDQNLPGIGATVQDKYFAGLSRSQLEAIGANGKKVYYNM